MQSKATKVAAIICASMLVLVGVQAQSKAGDASTAVSDPATSGLPQENGTNLSPSGRQNGSPATMNQAWPGQQMPNNFMMGQQYGGVSMNPMDPSSPMHPLNLMNQMGPMGGMGAMNPMNPMHPLNPMNPMHPMNSMNPMSPMNPMNPMNPASPMHPMHLMNQMNPMNPMMNGRRGHHFSEQEQFGEHTSPLQMHQNHGLHQPDYVSVLRMLAQNQMMETQLKHETQRMQLANQHGQQYPMGGQMSQMNQMNQMNQMGQMGNRIAPYLPQQQQHQHQQMQRADQQQQQQQPQQQQQEIKTKLD